MGEILNYVTWARVLIQQSDGNWFNATKWVSKASIDLGRVDQVGTGQTGADGIIRTASIDFKNERGITDNVSFSYKDQNSRINQVEGQFAPLLRDGHEILIQTAQIPYLEAMAGRRPLESEYSTDFHGVLGDDFDVTSEGASILCRDLSYKISGPQSPFYQNETFGSEAGVAAETVIQQMFDAKLGPGVLSLYCPVSPGWMVKEFTPKYKTPWHVANDIVNSFGWFFGFKKDPNGLYRPHLIEPPRNADAQTADFYIDWSGDMTKTSTLKTSPSNVRNYVIIRFTDTSGNRVELNPDEYPQLKDDTSIIEYNIRPFVVELASDSQIRTTEEALRFGVAALTDLKDQLETTTLELPFFNKMDVFKTMVVKDLSVSSTPNFYSCMSVQHTFDFSGRIGKMRTKVGATGKVVGGHRRWFDKEARVGLPGTPINIGTLDQTPPGIPLSLQVEKTVRVSRTGQVFQDNILSWNEVVGDKIEYLIYRKTDGDEYYQIDTTVSTTYTDSNLADNTTYTYQIKARNTVTGVVGTGSGEFQVTVDQTPEAPGGAIALTTSPEINAIRVAISHENAPTDIRRYEVYAETTSCLDVEGNLRAGIAPKSSYLGLFHSVPATPSTDYYIAVVAVNSSELKGIPVEIGPAQSRLAQLMDLSAELTQVEGSLYNSDDSFLRKLTDAEVESLYNVSNAIPIPLEKYIVLEYPSPKLINAVLIKTNQAEAEITLESSKDGSTYNLVSVTSVDDLGNEVKRYNFKYINVLRLKIKFTNVLGIFFVNLARPITTEYADYILTSILTTNRVNILSGDPDGNRQELSGSGRINFVTGADDVNRVVFYEGLQGNREYRTPDYPDPDNANIGKLLRTELASGEVWYYNVTTGYVVRKEYPSGRQEFFNKDTGDHVWTISEDGALLDKDEYEVISVNGGVNGKIVASGLAYDGDIIVSNLSIPDGYYAICTVEPYEFELWFVDSNDNEQGAYIGFNNYAQLMYHNKVNSNSTVNGSDWHLESSLGLGSVYSCTKILGSGNHSNIKLCARLWPRRSDIAYLDDFVKPMYFIKYRAHYVIRIFKE